MRKMPRDALFLAASAYVVYRQLFAALFRCPVLPEDLFGGPVDQVTEKSLRAELRAVHLLKRR
jgi:hypothetical protein